MEIEPIPGDLTADGAPVEQVKNPYSSHLKSKKYHLRAVEHMLKTSSSNHLKLSMMADNKAFIMISVNSIIISVAIGLVISKLVLNPKLTVPTAMLLLVNIGAIIYSVLATRPRTQKGTFTKKEVDEKTVNLLFYGSFYKMNFEDFDYGIKRLMDDNDFLLGTLKRDIFWQGKVIGHKFKLLRMSYDIFMYGTAASVFAYIIAALL